MYFPWPTREELRELAHLDHFILKKNAGTFPQTGITSYMVPTFWGEFVLSSSAFGAAFLFLPEADDFDIADRLGYYDIALSSTGRKMAVEVGLELMGYALGEIQTFETPVDISYLTKFQQDVLLACRRIPFGETCTYAEVSAMAGHPGKAGACAQVLRHNPLPILIPCHRVMPANRELGSCCAYPTWKHHMLVHEGIEKPMLHA